jgi:hypothetical protein
MPTTGSDNGTGGRPRPTGEGRLVFYECCISLIFITLRRPSRLYRLRVGEWGLLRGLPYTMVSLLLGWWGVPWGLIYTPLTLWTNLSGWREVTADEWKRWVGAAGALGGGR